MDTLVMTAAMVPVVERTSRLGEGGRTPLRQAMAQKVDRQGEKVQPCMSHC